MKKTLLILPLLYISINLSSQITEVATDISDPSSLALNGSNLYVSNRFADKIYIVDVTEINPVSYEFVDGVNGPSGLLLNGNDLYICEFDGDKVSRVDITAPNPIAVDVVTGLDGANELLLNGNDLYICASNSGKISKIDITETNPTPVDVITGLDFPNGLLLHGNDLYIVDPQADKISKIDITDVNPTLIDVVTGLATPARTPILINGELYFSEYYANKISKIDITQVSPSPIDAVIGINNPADLLLNDNCIYIIEAGTNKVLKYQFDPVAIEEIDEHNQVSLYPNPTSNYLMIHSKKQFNHVQIIDMNGKTIKQISCQHDEIRIDVNDLENGTYFLRIDNFKSLKFIKK